MQSARTAYTIHMRKQCEWETAKKKTSTKGVMSRGRVFAVNYCRLHNANEANASKMSGNRLFVSQLLTILEHSIPSAENGPNKKNAFFARTVCNFYRIEKQRSSRMSDRFSVHSNQWNRFSRTIASRWRLMNEWHRTYLWALNYSLNHFECIWECSTKNQVDWTNTLQDA